MKIYTAYFNTNNLSTLVQKNADYARANTIIRLLTGDKVFLYELIQEFHHQLQDIRVNHEYSATKDPGQDNKEWNKIRVRIV
ncbi:MAG: hypothetical protein HQ543_08490 [Bacteroidetes bacterium]|nr:hypothetical protein [Bacteroidota bacterium]